MATRNLRYFSQERDPRFLAGAGKGVCLVMATSYLIQAANGTDYWDWFNDNAGAVRELGQETRTPDRYFPQMRSIARLELGETVRAPTASLPINVLQGALGPFRLAVMDNPAWRMAHAIACYLGLKIRILDVSGGGEFQFDSRSEALQWLGVHIHQPRMRSFGEVPLSYAEGLPALTVYGFRRV